MVIILISFLLPQQNTWDKLLMKDLFQLTVLEVHSLRSISPTDIHLLIVFLLEKSWGGTEHYRTRESMCRWSITWWVRRQREWLGPSRFLEPVLWRTTIWGLASNALMTSQLLNNIIGLSFYPLSNINIWFWGLNICITPEARSCSNHRRYIY